MERGEEGNKKERRKGAGKEEYGNEEQREYKKTQSLLR